MTIPAKRNLERLACHYGHSMTTMLEMLVNERTVELLKKLNDWEQKNFFAQAANYRPTAKKHECDWEQKSFYSRATCNRMPPVLVPNEDDDAEPNSDCAV
jgi:hypothetical protein